MTLTLYEAHGILQFIAFAILFPIGALVAGLRNIISERTSLNWKTLHVTIQLTAVALVLCAVILIAIAKYKNTLGQRKEEDNKMKKIHKIIGPILLALILIQLVWAYKGKTLVEWNTWLYIHMMLSGTIITLGIFNVYVAFKMTGR